MTPKEFAIALQALLKSRYLERVAAALTSLGEPKDIVQDVVFSLLEISPEDCAKIRNLEPYAAQAVRRRCYELGRRRRFEPPLAKLEAAEERHLIHPSDASWSFKDPYQIYEQEQLRKLVRKSMDMLSPLERDIARRAHLDGETGPAIARRLQLSVHVVRGNRERARKKMETFLADLMKSDMGGGPGRVRQKPRGVGRGRDPGICWIVMLRAELAADLVSFRGWLETATDHRPVWARLKSGWRDLDP